MFGNYHFMKSSITLTKSRSYAHLDKRERNPEIEHALCIKLSIIAPIQLMKWKLKLSVKVSLVIRG